MEFINENTNKNDGVRENIQNLIKNYKIELKPLSKMIGVDYVWLKDYVDGKNDLNDFYTNINFNENSKEILNNSNIPNPSWLSNIIFMLYEGIKMINENDRVKGVIDGLIDEFEIKYETLSIYAGIGLEDVISFMNDSNSISYEKKYKLAVASLFLHYLSKKPYN